MEFEIRYAMLDSNLIFNPNEPSNQTTEKEEFFTALEKSILREGIRNPILVRCGWTPPESTFSMASIGWYRKSKSILPSDMQEDSKKILICYNSGGSRLWVAQKYKMKIPCIISDFIGRFSNELLVEKTEELILRLFKDKPVRILINSSGVMVQNLPNIHLQENN